MENKNSKLEISQRTVLLETLKARFEKNRIRHQDMIWDNVMARLESNPNI